MKRRFCTLLLICLLFAVMPAADAATGGVQSVEINVPCTVIVDVGAHGQVTAGGTVYRTGTGSFRVKPGTTVTFQITPASGYTVSVLTWSGADVLAQLKNGTYSVTVNHDEKLTVRFASETGRIWPWSGPKTGDGSDVGLWTAVLVISAAGLGALTRAYVKRRKKTGSDGDKE